MANLTNFDPPRRGLRCSNRSLTRYLSHVVERFGFIACATMILVRSFLLDWTTFRVHADGLCRPARFIDCESKSSDEIRQTMHVLTISRHNVSNYPINQREPSAALLKGRPELLMPSTSYLIHRTQSQIACKQAAAVGISADLNSSRRCHGMLTTRRCFHLAER